MIYFQSLSLSLKWSFTSDTVVSEDAMKWKVKMKHSFSLVDHIYGSTCPLSFELCPLHWEQDMAEVRHEAAANESWSQARTADSGRKSHTTPRHWEPEC